MKLLPDSSISCVHCGEVLTDSYDRDRGDQESGLYNHECKAKLAELLERVQ